jgi:hypothetical protein
MGGGKPLPIVQTPFESMNGAVSPWICCDMGCPVPKLIPAAKWHCSRRQIGNGAGSPRAVCFLHEVPASLG